uniref:L-Fucosyltransferase n=1 Tax=Acrobeloides nanus TaxID=290746 RepID=A0A914DWY1_9BILA
MNLYKSNETFVEIDTFPPHLPSYRYWKDYKEDILKMFSYSTNLTETVKAYGKKLLSEDTHVLCVHTRRGDFIQHKTLLESRKEFVESSIEYVVNFLKVRFLQNIDLVLYGTDNKFIDGLKIKKSNFNSIHKSKARTKGEDLAFAALHCHSFIHTASASSYGWWMAYLRQRKGFVFYNSQQKKNKKHIIKKDDYDIFPPDCFIIPYLA